MDTEREQPYYYRNLVAFWILGMCSTFSGMVMLTAAHDILNQEENNNATAEVANRTGKLIEQCNSIGTGAVLLADVLPIVLIKLTALFYIHRIPYNYRSVAIIFFQVISFPIVSYSNSVPISLLGVVFTSISCGLGEISYLSLTSHFSRNTISTWSSGTGMAGVAGALSYAGLTAVGITPRVTLLIMLVNPVIMTFGYFWLLKKPPAVNKWFCEKDMERTHLLMSESSDNQSEQSTEAYKVTQKTWFQSNYVKSTINNLKLMIPLWRYMLPVGLVYIAEYFINQGIAELIYFKHIWLPIGQQYRWYQVLYQFGVLFSRSSVNLITIKRIWLLAVLQVINVAFLSCEVFLQFLPSIWVVFIVILFEGLLGGAAYVNTFYRIYTEVQPEDREFSLGVTSLADSLGIAIAGALAIPAHNWVCTL